MRLENWAGKLRYPIRVGEHDQTAFSFGLLWDWAAVAGDDFARWLTRFLPAIPKNARKPRLPPAIVVDRTDPKLAHTDGLNLSRAWMLEGIAQGLPLSDRRIAALRAAALMHRESALPNITGEHYEGGHWLGTFVVYLTSEAGLPR
jgi:hypothetical protein